MNQNFNESLNKKQSIYPKTVGNGEPKKVMHTGFWKNGTNNVGNRELSIIKRLFSKI